MGGCSDAKVTIMVLNVDLDCCPCYRKVRKLLCKFPQIRDQVFDEKQNTVTITVVCCSPEKIKDKLCEKGGKSIKGIAIKESNKPKSEEKSKGGDEQSKDKKDKPKGGDEQTKDKKEKPKDDGEKPKSKSGHGDKDKDKDKEKKESSDGTKQKEATLAPAPAAAAAQVWMAEPEAQWVPGYPPGPPPQVYPVTVYYGGPSSCCEGLPVAPPYYQNHQGYGPQHPPAYYANRSDYFSDENPAACSIM